MLKRSISLFGLLACAGLWVENIHARYYQRNRGGNIAAGAFGGAASGALIGGLAGGGRGAAIGAGTGAVLGSTIAASRDRYDDDDVVYYDNDYDDYDDEDYWD